MNRSEAESLAIAFTGLENARRDRAAAWSAAANVPGTVVRLNIEGVIGTPPKTRATHRNAGPAVSRAIAFGFDTIADAAERTVRQLSGDPGPDPYAEEVARNRERSVKLIRRQ